MSYQLQEINRRIDQDVKGFLEACDAQYANKVSQAADTILNNLSTSPIVLLSGPSGSGKTTTALKIEEELEKRGVLSHTISMDNYFKTLNPKTVPRTKDGSIDFDQVSFKYSKKASRNALSHIDLHIKSGEIIGILGGTGSSKKEAEAAAALDALERMGYTTNGVILKKKLG